VTHYTKNSARIINQKLLHTRICSTANYNLGSSGSICKLGKSASLLKMAHWIELRDYSLSLSKTKEIYSFGLKRLSHDVDKLRLEQVRKAFHSAMDSSNSSRK
jgi:hypothetical protein